MPSLVFLLGFFVCCGFCFVFFFNSSLKSYVAFQVAVFRFITQDVDLGCGRSNYTAQH